MTNGKWTLEGYDSFAREEYPLSGEYETETEAVAAARTYLARVESMQPTESSGGQEGIQDRVYVLRPDGSRFRITP